jgi:HD-like signal output (HDOD) protein
MIDKIDTLQPIPPVANQILALAEKNDISLSELGDIIVVDPAISANMLKICNSAYFGLTAHVDSIHQAVTLLSIDQIVELFILNYVADTFIQEQNGYCLAEGDLWKQSAATAFTANSIAAEKGVTQLPFLSTATLLKDIGKVVMGNFVEHASTKIKYLILKEGLSFLEAEKAIFNIDHAELGGMIAKK